MTPERPWLRDLPVSARPPLADDHGALAIMAAELRDNAAANYPRLVEAGKVSEEEAEATVRALSSVAADRRRIVDLLAGNQAGGRDATATAAEKEAALEAAHTNAWKRYAKAHEDLCKALSPWALTAMAADLMTIEILVEARDLKLRDCKDLVELDVFLAARQRYWAIDALLWHQHGRFHPCFCAEITAEWRARDRDAREQQAAA